MIKINYSKFVPCLIFPLIVGFSASFLTIEKIGIYNALIKPAFSPPNWIFGPVWTILYLSIGVSFYLFTDSKSKLSKTYGNSLFYSQLILNFIWSLLFFNLHSPLFALIDISLLIVAIIFNIYYFYKINKTSGLILIPYLIWVIFAMYLNAGVYLLN